MPTPWPNAPIAGDLSSGSVFRKVTLNPLAALWDRDRVVEQAGSTVHIGADVDITDPPWSPIYTFQIRLSERMLASRNQQIRLVVLASAQSGGTPQFRLRDFASGNTGTEVSHTSFDFAPLESLLPIGDDSWADGTLRTIILEGGTTSGGFARYRTEGLGANLRFGDV